MYYVQMVNIEGQKGFLGPRVMYISLGGSDTCTCSYC